MTLIFVRDVEEGIECCADKKISMWDKSFDVATKIFDHKEFIVLGCWDYTVLHAIEHIQTPKNIRWPINIALHTWLYSITNYLKAVKETTDYSLLLVHKKTKRKFYVDWYTNVMEMPHEMVTGSGGEYATYPVQQWVPAEEIFTFVSSSCNTVSSVFDRIIIPHDKKNTNQKKVKKANTKTTRVLKWTWVHAKWSTKEKIT